MTHFATIADFTAQIGADAPTKAELALIEACMAGEGCMFSDGTRPTAPSPAHNIRATLLRLLILGGDKDHPTQPIGVLLIGGYITGPLNLNFEQAKGMTSLSYCTFTDPISALNTHFELLSLQGSHLPGLRAQGATVAGSVFLLKGFHATGEVSLSGAQIGGQLDCSEGRFDNPEGMALIAQGARVAGDVFLIKQFHATGTVSLSGAQIGGQLSCRGGHFDNPNGDALNAQNMQVRSGFIWREVTVDQGGINLTAAHVSDLVDDLKSWPTGENRLILDGFTYDRISGVFTDAPQRLEWLKRGTVWNGEFRPQPYVQLAKVLQAMGHRADARSILIAAESEARIAQRHRRRQRRRYIRTLVRFSKAPSFEQLKNMKSAGRTLPEHVSKQVPPLITRLNFLHFPQPRPEGAPPPLPELTRFYAQRQFRNDLRWRNGKDRIGIAWSHISDFILHRVTGYGHAPGYSAFWLIGLFTITTTLAHFAWEESSFAPNSDVILTSPEWRAYAESATANPAQAWAADKAPGQDWDSFNRYAYGIDVVVPILSLGQTDAWAPSTTRGPFGWHLWWARWVLSMAGWLVTALGAAAVTGIIRRD